ncbi:MAG TPA: hypothetical protein VEJ87_04330 [Acidimicrobiales bacterium]|nr:hypothetical protein [Acidimicrobiales bacterium]
MNESDLPRVIVGEVSPKRKMFKPLAVLGALGTIASIWWFALKPRRKRRDATK